MLLKSMRIACCHVALLIALAPAAGHVSAAEGCPTELSLVLKGAPSCAREL